jgi:hypothetical protein
MTPSSRLLRTLLALLALVATALPGATVVLANGIGDLYVGLPAGVTELYLKEEQLLFTVELDAEPLNLAFTNDGTSLYAGDGRRSLVRIDIGDMTVADQYTLTDDVPSFAHPKGGMLYLAVPADEAFAIIADGEAEIAAGPALHGPADLVAADRRDFHVVAAESGKGWVDVLDTVSNTVTKVDVDGGVVALTVAADDGVAFVASASPDTLTQVDLDTGKVAWKVRLEAAPSAVTWAGTESPRMAIAAVGDTLVWAKDGETATWATLEAAPGAISTADEGAYVYAATPTGLTTVTVADPTAKPAAEIALDSQPAALAPIPKTSSLSKSGGSGSGSQGSGTTGQAGSGGPDSNGESPTKAPATDTEGEGGRRFRPAGPDPLLLLGGAALIAVIVVAGTRGAIGRLTKEP